MFRASLVALLLTVAPSAAQPKTHQVKLNGHTFTLPEGFTIELAAGSGVVPRPIAAAFDEKGRLYVTDSSGSNEKVQAQLDKKPHRVLRLESTKGDGVFDKQTVFVKNVMFPEGCMWLNGSLYVAAPPHILKFTDTNDDGTADKEEVWFDGKTLTGCANDLHGPYPGPDGFIYWAKGAFARQEYTVNGKPFATRASHLFRARPDGSGLEPVMTGGMDNPVDLVFTPGGDIIFNCTFFQHPAGGRRDGLIHAIYGGVYGKDHDVVYEHPRTAPALMPVLTHMGPAAPAGLHRYESDQFGPDFTHNIFCCQFNLRKVSRHVLVPKGSTYETQDSDFVVSDNLDFHPTDVVEDADGSLLIVDTGGWYKLCCPTSQLVKPDVTGAIYRVRKMGAHKMDDPRGLKLSWAKVSGEEFGKRLRDPRLAVRSRAVEELLAWPGDGTDTARSVLVRALASDNPRDVRLAALWALSREKKPSFLHFRNLVKHDKDEIVRAAAANVLGIHRHQFAVEELAERLATDPLPVRRAIAQALGRIGDPDAVPAIALALKETTNDRALDHALTYALIEIGGSIVTVELLADPNPAARRAALAALSNVPNGLKAGHVLRELDSKDAALRDTAWWVAGRNPEWGDEVAGHLRAGFKRLDAMTPPERDELVGRAVPLMRSAAVRKAVGDALNAVGPGQRALLRGMARSGHKALPAEWRDGVRLALCGDPDTARDAVLLLRVAPVAADDFAKLRGEVLKYRERLNIPMPKELDYALRATGPAGAVLSDDEANVVIGDVGDSSPGPVRAAAADLLARSKLSAESLAQLANALAGANPLELPKLLAAFDKSTDPAVGAALVRSLRSAKVRPLVRAEMVKPILDKYPAAVKAEAEKLYAELAEARKGETARLDAMLKELKPGDVRRGQVVFNGAKTNCIACHKVGYVGGTAGPDLTRIGGIRSERDLLESILYPSASFVRSYEPVRVVTKDDRTLNGVLKKDAPDEIVIVVAADKEERIARDNIESIAPSAVSLMPAGLEQQLTAQEIADLLAFLKACK